MLTSLRLRNFKNHSLTELKRLTQLGVFVGPNGAGKSSVLEAAWLLHQLGAEQPERLFASLGEKPTELVRKGQQDGEICAVGQVTGGQYRAELQFPAPANDWSNALSIQMDGNPVKAQYNDRGLIAPEWIAKALSGVVVYRLEPRQLAMASHAAKVPAQVLFNGYGLASVVGELSGEYPETLAEITARLRAVVPSVLRVRTRRKSAVRATDQMAIHADELLFDTVDGVGIPGSSVSAGTLIALALLTAMCLPGHAELILLDDVESGLHPKAQRELMRVLRKLTQDDPKLQILMTTHSPYILDELDAGEVWVFGRADKQAVSVKRLKDHPNAEEALRVLTTGEFWSTEGESWTEKPT